MPEPTWWKELWELYTERMFLATRLVAMGVVIWVALSLLLGCGPLPTQLRDCRTINADSTSLPTATFRYEVCGGYVPLHER